MWASWLKKAERDPEAEKRVRMFQHRPPIEFYNLTSDQWEINNTASLPENDELIKSLRKRLEDWMKKQGDLGIETEMRAFERQGKRPNML